MGCGKHDGLSQTPNTGLRHPSLEEGAGKRCSECGSEPDSSVQTNLPHLTVADIIIIMERLTRTGHMRLHVL